DLRYRFSTRFRTSTDGWAAGAGEPSGMNLNTTVEQMFAPARQPGRVGAEVELISVTDTTRPRPADPAVLAAGFDAGFIRAASPTFEPGGQLELSPPPRPSAAAQRRGPGPRPRPVAAACDRYRRGARGPAGGRRPQPVPLRRGGPAPAPDP